MLKRRGAALHAPGLPARLERRRARPGTAPVTARASRRRRGDRGPRGGRAPEPAGPGLARGRAIRRRSPAISSTTSRSPSMRASASVTWSPARSKRRSIRASPSSSPVTSTRSSQRGSDGLTTLRRLLSASGLRPEARLEQVRDRARRPRLRLAGDGIGHRLVELRAREAGEQLRQPVVVEPRRRLEQPLEDRREVLVEPVAAQPEGDQRAVVRPDRAGVVADRVVGGMALRRACSHPSPVNMSSPIRTSRMQWARSSRHHARPRADGPGSR